MLNFSIENLRCGHCFVISLFPWWRWLNISTVSDTKTTPWGTSTLHPIVMQGAWTWNLTTYFFTWPDNVKPRSVSIHHVHNCSSTLVIGSMIRSCLCFSSIKVMWGRRCMEWFAATLYFFMLKDREIYIELCKHRNWPFGLPGPWWQDAPFNLIACGCIWPIFL